MTEATPKQVVWKKRFEETSLPSLLLRRSEEVTGQALEARIEDGI